MLYEVTQKSIFLANFKSILLQSLNNGSSAELFNTKDIKMINKIRITIFFCYFPLNRELF